MRATAPSASDEPLNVPTKPRAARVPLGQRRFRNRAIFYYRPHGGAYLVGSRHRAAVGALPANDIFRDSLVLKKRMLGLAVLLACLHVHAGLTDGHGPRTPVLRPACFAPPAAVPRPNARLAPAEPVRAPRGLARGLEGRGSVCGMHRLRHPKLPRLGMYGPLMEVGYKVRLY